MLYLKHRSEPVVEMWIGNFFEPFYSSKEAMRKGLFHIKELGFNTFNLDSKSSQDFQERFQGKEASQYVAMQEFAIEVGKELGIYHDFLAIFMNGDNLYPTVRNSPPVFGEECIDFCGKGMKTYKYWSEKAQEVMVRHCRGLLDLYRDNHLEVVDETGAVRYPIRTMFDPDLKPSFDEEGRRRYLGWLKGKYKDIRKLNERYQTNYLSFKDLKPKDYWYKPEEVRSMFWTFPSLEDYQKGTPYLFKWIDNQRWRVEETTNFFRVMQAKYKELDYNLYLYPNIQQWRIFFNDGSPSWFTAGRGLDPWEISPYVDSLTFITAPIDTESRPDCYVVSSEISMMRCMQPGRDFIAGLYFGRYCFEDIYAHISPAEVIATACGNGAKGLHVYGYSGLDDGGVFYKMPPDFLNSVSVGNNWFKKVVPLIDESRRKEVAILFPKDMALLEPVGQGTIFSQHRLDLLGWYKQILDLGYMVDILHPQQVKEGALVDYFALVLPIDSCYKFSIDDDLEQRILNWVREGGVILHGANNLLVRNCFGIEEKRVESDCIQWEEKIIPESIYFSSFKQGKPVAKYIQTQEPAIVENGFGKGKVYSFGFNYGYAYTKKTMSGVPSEYGKEEIHPVILLDKTPVELLLSSVKKPSYEGVKGIEYCDFFKHLIIINHNPFPHRINGIDFQEAVWQYEVGNNILIPHSAVYFKR